MDDFIIKGAVGDGIHDDTAAVQAALDKGGLVVFESGKTYYCSSLALRSNTELHFLPGARILASGDLSTYYSESSADDDSTRKVGTPVTRKPSYSFIHARDVENITFSGHGVIDGNCYAFIDKITPYKKDTSFYPKPTMVYIENGRNITFKDVTFTNSPFWTIHPAGCFNVLIQGITIDNPLDVANSDGIDPDHSRRVRIIGCDIRCADDCICLKNSAGNTEYPHTKDVLITGCTLTSTSAALKIGTEGVDDFESLVVTNCVISGTNRGISIQIRDKGSVRDALFSDILIETRRFADGWWGSAEAVAVTAFDRDESTDCGFIENVRFNRVISRGENGFFLSGKKGKIKNIYFKDCRAEIVKTSKWPDAGHDLRPRAEAPLFLDSPARPFESRNCENVVLEGFEGSYGSGADAQADPVIIE